MLCGLCWNNVLKLRSNGSCPPQYLPLLKQQYDFHMEKNELEEKPQKNKDNRKRRSNEDLKRKDQVNQNKVKKKRRQIIAEAKETGDVDALVAAGRSTGRYQNRLKTAIARGFEADNFDFEQKLAVDGEWPSSEMFLFIKSC